MVKQPDNINKNNNISGCKKNKECICFACCYVKFAVTSSKSNNSGFY